MCTFVKSKRSCPPFWGNVLSGYVRLGKIAITACAVPFRTTQGELGIVLCPSLDKWLTLFWCSATFVLVLVHTDKTSCCISASYCCCELWFTLLQKSAPVLGESEMPALFSATETFSKISLVTKVILVPLSRELSLCHLKHAVDICVMLHTGQWNLCILEFYKLKLAQTNKWIDAA